MEAGPKIESRLIAASRSATMCYHATVPQNAAKHHPQKTEAAFQVARDSAFAIRAMVYLRMALSRDRA
jgi:hypothetical protein